MNLIENLEHVGGGMALDVAIGGFEKSAIIASIQSGDAVLLTQDGHFFDIAVRGSTVHTGLIVPTDLAVKTVEDFRVN